MGVNNENSQALIYGEAFNPNLASGILLDALCAFSNLYRTPATYTTVNCQLTGIGGTLIPAGSIVVDQYTQNQFINTSNILLGIGTTNATFRAVKSGAIIVSANSITIIQNGVSGWSTINNATAGNTGSDIQNDTSLRNTRNYTLSLNSIGWAEALSSALANFLSQNGITETATGNRLVQGYYIGENPTATPAPMGNTGIEIAPFSVYITVYAPNFLFNSDGTQNATNAQQMAGIILRTKAGGCQTQNLQSLPNAFNVNYVTDTQVAPINIKFDSPVAIPIQFNVSVVAYNNTIPTSQLQSLVANAILSQYYNGYGVFKPINMVQDINAFNFIPAIISVTGNITVSSITIQTVSAGTPVTTFPALPPTQIATLALNNIIVQVNT